MKKVVSLVLAMLLALSCVSVFADGTNVNKYNYKETEGSTKVTLGVTEYWQWTVPAEVKIDFTKKKGGEPFGKVTIENVLLSEDKVITVSLKEVSDLSGGEAGVNGVRKEVIGKNNYIQYEVSTLDEYYSKVSSSGEYEIITYTPGEYLEYTGYSYTYKITPATSLWQIKIYNEEMKLLSESYVGSLDECYSYAMKEGYTNIETHTQNLLVCTSSDGYKVQATPASDTIDAIMKDGAYDGWGLQQYYSEKLSDDDAAKVIAERTDTEDTAKNDTCGTLRDDLVESKLATVKENDIILAVRSDIANGTLYQITGTDKQKANVYNAGKENDVLYTVYDTSTVTGSIQGNDVAAETQLYYFCWGTPSTIATYEGKVTYTCSSATIDATQPIASEPKATQYYCEKCEKYVEPNELLTVGAYYRHIVCSAFVRVDN